MATTPLTLSSLFNLAPNAAGGFGVANTTPAVLPQKPKKTTSTSSLSQLSIPTPYTPPVVPPQLAGLGSKIAIGPNGMVVHAPSAVPVAPVIPSSTPLFSGAGVPTGPTAPIGPTAPTGATGATGSAIPPQYLNADGSIKTPDQVAAAMGSALKSAHGNGDVGTLALEQFGGNGGSTADATAEARRIGNTRNDIAVGETDPYKVASQSGIAYTPAELNAIEKAYAGVYDPALDTALAKVQTKQDADKAKAAADAQAKQPFTLGKDQVRYDADGNIVAVGASDTPASTTYVAGANPVVDAYVTGFKAGTYKASDIPDAYKDLVAQGVAAGSGANAPLSKTSTDAIGIINQLQNSTDLGKLSGTGAIGAIEHPSSVFPGTAVQPLQNLAKQLAATLSLANRQQLKGQGAISDFEFRVLGDASTALGIDANGRTNLSEADFKKGLQNLELKLQVGPTSLTDDEIQYLASPAGGSFTPDDIRAYSAQQSFNDVGNTTASTLSTTKAPGTGNIPQRNNNPGDIKAGSQADALAIGKDSQGHLIFPDAATGFKALAGDLAAKIKGTSKLPANPTIAQLGAVYAEDPNWPKKVASILGVPVDTHTAAVPLDKLIQAVATQEGFYA